MRFLVSKTLDLVSKKTLFERIFCRRLHKVWCNFCNPCDREKYTRADRLTACMLGAGLAGRDFWGRVHEGGRAGLSGGEDCARPGWFLFVRHKKKSCGLQSLFEARRIISNLSPSIRGDNGPELTSRQFLAWNLERQVGMIHRQSLRPTRNGYCEGFHGKRCEECLRIRWFQNLLEARKIIADGRRGCNEQRSHSSLNELLPAEFAGRQSREIDVDSAHLENDEAVSPLIFARAAGSLILQVCGDWGTSAGFAACVLVQQAARMFGHRFKTTHIDSAMHLSEACSIAIACIAV